MPKTGIRSYTTRTQGQRWLAYCHRDGKQVLKLGFRTGRQAERWRSEALTKAKATSPQDSRLTVGEWVGEWVERHKPRIKTPTYRHYQEAVSNWIIPHLGTIHLTSLNHRHIEAMHEAAVREACPSRTAARTRRPSGMAY